MAKSFNKNCLDIRPQVHAYKDKIYFVVEKEQTFDRAKKLSMTKTNLIFS
jgi:hypothetical protein